MIAYGLITRTLVNIGKVIYDDLVSKLSVGTIGKAMTYPQFVSLLIEYLVMSMFRTLKNRLRNIY